MCENVILARLSICSIRKTLKPLAVLGIWVLAAGGALITERAVAMDKIHVQSPEAVVFLELAAKSLHDHHARHRRYPATWPELDFTYAAGPYHMTDPDIRPGPEVKDVWEPRGSSYSYRLRLSPDGQKFSIDAINAAGKIEYRITSDRDTAAAAQ